MVIINYCTILPNLSFDISLTEVESFLEVSLSIESLFWWEFWAMFLLKSMLLKLLIRLDDDKLEKPLTFFGFLLNEEFKDAILDDEYIINDGPFNGTNGVCFSGWAICDQVWEITLARPIKILKVLL